MYGIWYGQKQRVAPTRAPTTPKSTITAGHLPLFFRDILTIFWSSHMTHHITFILSLQRTFIISALKYATTTPTTTNCIR